MINIKNIWKQFNGEQVHCGVSVDIPDRETVVVLGKSGGGKSVLLKMIVGLVKPDKGNIIVDGNEVTNMRYRELRSHRMKFGFLFQGAALLDSLTVGENVALPLQYHRRKKVQDIPARVKRALETVGLEGVEQMMPASLSGGMRKRVGLARAIVYQPPYVLYDEPTTGLDLETADGINTLINDLRTKLGVTSIVVTHDIRSAFVVGDRFAILNEGRIIMTGTADEIRNSPNEEVRKYIDSNL
ncbi:ATP-binding cassette domain-containing protein [bacterium]|nr:MAG: ATP-binding cassette domain-containing protein [bacterium]